MSEKIKLSKEELEQLKSFQIRNNDIKKISAELKQLKLANIYSGRKLSLIFK